MAERLVNIVGSTNLKPVNAGLTTGGGGVPVPGGSVSLATAQPQAPTIQPLQVPNYQQMQDVTEDKWAQLRADSERRYQDLMAALQARQQIRVAQATASGQSDTRAGIAGLLGTASDTLMFVHQQNLEKQQKEMEYQQAVDEMNSRAALEEIFMTTGQRLREYGDEEGIFSLRRDVGAYLRSDEFRRLTPQVQQELWEFVGTRIREVEDGFTTRYRNAADETHDRYVSSISAQVRSVLSGHIASLSSPSLSPQQRTENFNDFMSQLSSLTEGLDINARMEIIAPLVEDAATRMTEGQVGYNQLSQTASDMQRFSEYYNSTLLPQFGNDPTRLQWEVQSWIAVNAPSLAPLADNVPTPMTYERNAAEREELAYERWQRDRQVNQSVSNQYSPEAAISGAQMAWSMRNTDPALYAQVRSMDPADRTPAQNIALHFYDQVVALEEQYRQANVKYQESNQEMRQMLRVYEQGQVIMQGADGQPVLAAPETSTFTDQTTGRTYRVFVTDTNPLTGQPLRGQLVYAPVDMSQEELNSQLEIMATHQSEINNILDRARQMGFNIQNPRDQSYIQQLQQDYNRAIERDQLRELSGAPPDPATSGTYNYSEPPTSLSQRVQQRTGFNWASSDPPPGYPSGIPPMEPLARYTRPQNLTAQTPATNYNEGRTAPVSRVVLHETVGDLDSALSTIQGEGNEVSYHYIIGRDGQVYNTVDYQDTAFGALRGNEGSIHISLESPDDGRGNDPEHSGYTPEQYSALAELMDRNGWSGLDRTTHRDIANEQGYAGERSDPRSFDEQQFQAALQGRSAGSAQQQQQLAPSIQGLMQNLPQPSPQEQQAIATRSSPRPVMGDNLEVVDGTPLPISRAYRNIQITSPYGMRQHPVYGQSRFHTGIDIGSEEMYESDVGALTVQGGKVVGAWNWDGYGGTVLVQTPTGHVEQYSHLRSFHVRVGDDVIPGQVVGIIGGGEGDPMPGISTARHLHFTVWSEGWNLDDPNSGDSIDPITYLQNAPTFEFTQRDNQGITPYSENQTGYLTPAANSWSIGNGNAMDQNFSEQYPYLSSLMNAVSRVPIEQYHNIHNPIPTPSMPESNNSNYNEYDGNNDPTQNYGYTALRDDHQARRALAEVANELGVEAVWLADIIHFESRGTWSTTVPGPEVNWDGAIHRGYGLIQLMSFNFPTYGIRGVQDLANMSRADYIRRVIRPYLNQFKGRMHSIVDVYEAIWHGTVGEASRLAGQTDGYNEWTDIIRRLGAAQGRRYRIPGEYQSSLQHTHDTYDPECSICQQQMNRFGAVIPHEAIA